RLVHHGRLPDQALRVAGEGRDLAAAGPAQRGRVPARARRRRRRVRGPARVGSDLMTATADPTTAPTTTGAVDRDAVREILDKALAEGRESLTAPEGRRVCTAYGIPTPGE